VYDCAALHVAYTITLVVLSCVAATCWILYFYLVLSKSERIRTHWLKRLTDLLLMLLIALVGFFLSLLLSGFHLHRR